MTSLNRAQKGLSLLKDAILEYLIKHPDGVTNAKIVKDLHLQSDFEGKHNNYLAWSIIGFLLREGRVRYEGERKAGKYFLNNSLTTE